MGRSLILLCISICVLNCLEAYRDSLPYLSNGFDKCDYGRHLTIRCVGKHLGETERYCPAGFYCYPYTPIGKDGPCCRSRNPCRKGNPYKVNDDAVTCSRRRRCPTGHVCTTGKGYAVCCPRQLSQGCPVFRCRPVRPKCARPRYYIHNGRICRHCDRNTCRRSSIKIQ